MLKGGIPIGRLFGIDLRLHYSWFFVFALVTWALAGSYFPAVYPGWSTATAVTAGVITSLLFFASVMAHELMHSVVAQSIGLTVESITLFIFGGVSQITSEPKLPRDEFRMALAGPLTSLILSGLFWLVWFWLRQGLPVVGAVATWLWYINLSLGLFNLVPGFPLDGGRVLRSFLWWRTGNLKKATRTASTIGQGVGFLFIFGGIVLLFRGNFVNGLWIAFIGWFLQSAAAGSYRQLALQERLQGHTASEIMVRDCQLVTPDTSVEQLVNEQILKTGRRCFPVANDGGEILGLMGIHNARTVPRENWATTPVRAAMTPYDQLKWVRPDTDLAEVMRLLSEADINQVPVMEDHKIVGMVSRDNLVNFINIRGELGA